MKNKDFLDKLPKKCKKIPNWYLQSIKQAAASQNIPFLVSDQYLIEIFEKQNYKCALTGEDLWFCEKSANMVHQNASIDRIDHKKGFLEGNVQLVVKEIARMKSKFSQEKVIELCLKVALYSLNT